MSNISGVSGLDWTVDIMLIISLLPFEVPAAPGRPAAAPKSAASMPLPSSSLSPCLPAPCDPFSQVGRTGRPSSSSAAALSALLAECPGASITLTAADAACAADAPALWGSGAAARGAGSVGVVVHASGVLADAALAGQTTSGLRR